MRFDSSLSVDVIDDSSGSATAAIVLP